MSSRAALTIVLFSWLLAACDRAAEAPPPVPAAERAPVPAPSRVSPRRLATGPGFSCVIAGARVVCWGDVPDDSVVVPHAIEGFDGAIEIAAGTGVICALREADGGPEVLCRGPRADVRFGVEGETDRIRELAGARSIAIVRGRICGIVEDAVVCFEPNGEVDRVPGVPPRAVLTSVGDTACVIDGEGPAWCTNGTEPRVWELGGSRGAISLAQALGTCAVLADGALADGTLACAEGAPGASSLRVVPGARARAVAGSREVRCVLGETELQCEGLGDAPVRLEHADLREVAVASRHGVAHGCALRGGGGVWCFGSNAAGEALPAEPRVRRVESASDFVGVSVLQGAVRVLDRSGHAAVLDGVGYDRWERELGPPMAAIVDHDPRLGIARDGALLGGWARDGARTVFRGRAVRVEHGVCGATPRGIACVPVGYVDRAGVVLVPGLRGGVEPFAHGRLICARVGREVRCASTGLRGALPHDAAPIAPDLPPIARALGGAEQAFLRTTSGEWLALGHNGAGQLGLPPSRPLGPTPVTLPAGTGAGAAFAQHASCVWGPGTGLHCAGLDDRLRIRDVLRRSSAEVRGDGSFREIPGVRDVRAVSLGDPSCAVDGEGALWCWGRGFPPSEVTFVGEPVEIALP